MIDKNGKLFGKINIIDLLIILIIIAAGILVAVRATRGKTASGVQTARLTFFGDEVPDFVADHLVDGIRVTQYSTDIDMGHLVSHASEPAYKYDFNGVDDEAAQLPVANRSYVTLVCEMQGTPSEMGFTIGETTFTVGGNYWLNVGATRAGYMLRNIEVVG